MPEIRSTGVSLVVSTSLVEQGEGKADTLLHAFLLFSVQSQNESGCVSPLSFPSQPLVHISNHCNNTALSRGKGRYGW